MRVLNVIVGVLVIAIYSLSANEVGSQYLVGIPGKPGMFKAPGKLQFGPLNLIGVPGGTEVRLGRETYLVPPKDFEKLEANDTVLIVSRGSKAFQYLATLSRDGILTVDDFRVSAQGLCPQQLRRNLSKLLEVKQTNLSVIKLFEVQANQGKVFVNAGCVINGAFPLFDDLSPRILFELGGGKVPWDNVICRVIREDELHSFGLWETNGKRFQFKNRDVVQFVPHTNEEQ